MLDPVSVVAGVIKTELPSLDMQTCAKLAWDIVQAIKGISEVKETTQGKEPGA